MAYLFKILVYLSQKAVAYKKINQHQITIKLKIVASSYHLHDFLHRPKLEVLHLAIGIGRLKIQW